MNYYNENDPNAAAWLLGLIEDGLVPNGEVDVRSITEVQPADLVGYAQLHFFAGIGGWPLALQLAGWADDRPVITGSCPCQPFSAAGKQAGEKDERHLWPEFARIIRGLREFGSTAPVMGEQVASKLGRIWLAGVRSDLEAMGHGVWAVDTCSASVGSPNIRQRLYWMAYCNSDGLGKARPSVSSIGNDGFVRNVSASRLEVAGLSGERRPPRPREEEGMWSSGESSGSGTGSGVAQPLGNTNDTRLQGRSVDTECTGERPAGPPVSFGRWSEFDIVHCRDGKIRRIPKASLESGLQCMVDGLQLGVDPIWHQGYPLSFEKIEGRPAILKGIGNAINPCVAAEFIRSFMEDV